MFILFKKIRSSHIPIIILHIILTVIVLTNFHFGKTFIGWDSINAELNIGLNIKRAVFSGWQEYYGVGLLGGHGFAALLPFSLTIYFLSLFLPAWAIKTCFTFIFIYLGILGMYFLISYLLKKVDIFKDRDNSSLIEWCSLFSSIVYLVNLGTVQQLFTQTDTFTIHFGALPWMFLTTIYLLDGLSIKRIFTFLLVHFIFSSHGFIPPIFITYFFAIIFFLIAYYALMRFNKEILKRGLIICGLILIVNSYWILPFAINQLSSKSLFLESYNNLIQTEEFIQKNIRFGDLTNVSLIKGFFWESKLTNGYLFSPWRDHFQNQVVPLLGYSMFIIALLGIATSIILFKKPILIAYIGIFLFFFANLAVNLAPFSYVINLLQSVSSTFKQAFRNPFTKFSIGLAFSYSLFFVIGIYTTLSLFKSKLKNISISFFYPIILGCIIFYGLPIFNGQLFSNKLFAKIPEAYEQTIDYFKDKGDGRIADFPQDCPEGWYSYNWGYVGSGFLWYGIRQPFLSRTFDVWHNANENYYWEIVQAVREKNFDKIDKIFQKYDVHWIIYDGNLKHCRNQKAFLQDEQFLEYLNASNVFTLQQKNMMNVSSPILIYEFNKYSSSSYVQIHNNLPNILPKYDFTDDDRAINQSLPYITTDTQLPDIILPFRSLFNKRKPSEKDFVIKENDNSYVITSEFSYSKASQFNFTLPQYKDLESILPIKIEVKQGDGANIELNMSLLIPSIILNNHLIFPNFNTDFIHKTIKINKSQLAKLIVNENEYRLQSNTIIQTYLYTQINNSITLINQEGSLLFRWNSNEDINYLSKIENEMTQPIKIQEGNTISVMFPRINDNKKLGKVYLNELLKNINEVCSENNDQGQSWQEISSFQNNVSLRLTSQNKSQCLNFDFPDAESKLGYLLSTETKTSLGSSPLRVNLINRKGSFYLLTDLNNADTFNATQVIIPPSYTDAVGYQAIIENNSYNNNKTVNEIANLGLWYIPFNVIKSIQFTSSSYKDEMSQINSNNIMVTHPNETRYEVSFDVQSLNPENSYISLFQSFHSGWKAYNVSQSNFLSQNFPFIFGTELKNHILINNWANGWELNQDEQNQCKDQKCTIIILFWPQYLEFAGFIIIIILVIFALNRRKNQHNSTPLN